MNAHLLLIGDAVVAAREGFGVAPRVAHLLRRSTGLRIPVLDFTAPGGLSALYRRLPYAIGHSRAVGGASWCVLAVGGEDAATDPPLVEWLDIVESTVEALIHLAQVRHQVTVLLPEPTAGGSTAAARWLRRVHGPLSQRVAASWPSSPRITVEVATAPTTDPRTTADGVAGVARRMLEASDPQAVSAGVARLRRNQPA